MAIYLSGVWSLFVFRASQELQCISKIVHVKAIHYFDRKDTLLAYNLLLMLYNTYFYFIPLKII